MAFFKWAKNEGARQTASIHSIIYRPASGENTSHYYVNDADFKTKSEDSLYAPAVCEGIKILTRSQPRPRRCG